MFRFPPIFSGLCVVILLILSGCGAQPTQAVQDLHPLACHREPFVGMLFILIKNDGMDAGTSSMHISYTATGSKQAPVSVQMNLPFIPAHTQRMVMVNLPTSVPGAVAATDKTHYKNPASKVVIQLSNQAGGAKPAASTFLSACNDPN
jgi:hypothetical protein